MYKELSWLVRSIILVCLAIGGCAQGNPQIRAAYIPNGPIVDGVATDWSTIKSLGLGISFYKGDGHTSTNTIAGTTCLGTISNASDARVDLWVVHDGTRLYLLAEVHDDAWESFGMSNNNMAYLEDTLHIYLDSTNSRRDNISSPPISTQAGYEQFGCSTDLNLYGENVDLTTGSAKTVASIGTKPDNSSWRVACQVQSVTGGYIYTFEESILLAGRTGRNMAALTPGNTYGFNAEWCDADRGDDLQGYIFWSSKPGIDAWNQENLWGQLILDPVPEPSSFLLILFSDPLMCCRSG